MPGLFDYPDSHFLLEFQEIHSGRPSWLRRLSGLCGELCGTTTTTVYPVWETVNDRSLNQIIESANGVYHLRARLNDGREALLIDPGAVSNLAGDRWIKRVGKLAQDKGYSIHFSALNNNIMIEGVGKGAQTCSQKCALPMQTTSASAMTTFEAPVVPDSDIPGLLGLADLKARNCLLDCRQGVLYEVNGQYSLTCGKGSVKHQLEPAMSGHWMLPITEYQQ